MKKLVFAALLVAMPTFAFGQQVDANKEYTLNVNAADVVVIGKALGKMPFEEVAQLMQKLQIQINKQNTPAPTNGNPAPTPTNPK